jgi:hypothetical protein
MSLDAIGEFKVSNSVFSAEHGRNLFFNDSATTESGGRQFHGTAYEFLRNEALDARDSLAASKSKLRLNQFGGNVSGPIPLWKVSKWSDPKLFFFFNMEFIRGTRPNGSPFVDVPHPDLLNGDFRRLLRTNTLAGLSCLYPGETAARPARREPSFGPVRSSVIRQATSSAVSRMPTTLFQEVMEPQRDGILKLIGRWIEATAFRCREETTRSCWVFVGPVPPRKAAGGLDRLTSVENELLLPMGG